VSDQEKKDARHDADALPAFFAVLYPVLHHDQERVCEDVRRFLEADAALDLIGLILCLVPFDRIVGRSGRCILPIVIAKM